MTINEQAAENLFSPAALKIIRRHQPDPDDPRYCRRCGRPTVDCDVLALARIVAAGLRREQVRRASEAASAAESLPAAAGTPRATAPRTTPRRRATGARGGTPHKPEVAPA